MHTKNVWISLIGVILLAAIIAIGAVATSPKNEPVMLLIQATNKDVDSATEDYWVGSTQTVYYDGDVEYIDEYNLTGKKNKETWEIEETTLNDIRILLSKIDVIDSEELTTGIQHRITYYDREGNVLLEYYGSIEGNTFSRIVYQVAQ